MSLRIFQEAASIVHVLSIGMYVYIYIDSPLQRINVYTRRGFHACEGVRAARKNLHGFMHGVRAVRGVRAARKPHMRGGRGVVPPRAHHIYIDPGEGLEWLPGALLRSVSTDFLRGIQPGGRRECGRRECGGGPPGRRECGGGCGLPRWGG